VACLFGFGPGKLVESSLLGPRTLAEISEQEFGIAYGITGFVWLVLQVGFLGVALLSWFFYGVFRRAYRAYRASSDRTFQTVALGFLGLNCVFFLDFYTYSKASLTLGVLTPVYFYIAFLVLRNRGR
jgi:hypothetical protein